MLKPLFSAIFKNALALDFAGAGRARTSLTAGRWSEAVAAVPPLRRGAATIHDAA
jgi:hypothetical protein